MRSAFVKNNIVYTGSSLKYPTENKLLKYPPPRNIIAKNNYILAVEANWRDIFAIYFWVGYFSNDPVYMEYS